VPAESEPNALNYLEIMGAANGQQETLACRFDTSYYNQIK